MHGAQQRAGIVAAAFVQMREEFTLCTSRVLKKSRRSGRIGLAAGA